ncbi:MAG: chemotaxis protein CheB, partial [Kofleriaceae bacterium]
MTPGRRGPALPQRVVGIGASAGGLDALKQLFARLPADTGLAFVVLQHLPPSQVGKLAQILARVTAMPVVDVETGQRVAADHVYVVPPRIAAGLFRGALVLRTPKGGARPHLPIDGLLGSLASVLGERAIGVVLSGTASDGTGGLRAIRAASGLTFAQDPATAQFDEMPRSAIAAGVADEVRAPGQIADELATIARRIVPQTPRGTTHGLDAVLQVLRDASGIDFTSYKRTTIERRLARRLAKHRLASLDDYLRYLTAHPAEASEVYEDLLIHVTEFFRDQPALDELVARVLPEINRDKPADAPIRVWVPGCATGEEVYTLAILLLEQLGEQRVIQLFGTDLSARSIETARAGRYPAAIAARVSPERLARFFRVDGTGFQIKRSVRERCVFVRHDLVSDPPFSKLDLVSCRNVLIYLGPPLQKRAIGVFHYALNQPGYLVLGRAEAVSGFDALFGRIESDAPIFARKPAANRAGLIFPLPGLARPSALASERPRSALDLQRDIDHLLLARYGPACVLVDHNLDVLQFRGRTGPYLEPAPGQPQLNVLRMAREGLASDLRLAIQRAQRTDAPVHQGNIAITEDNRTRSIDLEVLPLRGATETQRNFLIVFTESAPAASSKPARRGKPPNERSETVRLRQELAATREYLHSVVVQHLATSEELGVTNEELQSTNEELQSSNEELQTAKEELQSTNEELETVNEELQRGNQELRQVNDDLTNVLASVELAIIIVDAERRIRRFTPKARAVMRLIPGDLGRPIADLQPSLAIIELDRAIASVIASRDTHEAEVVHDDGTCYRMQIRPYCTTDQEIDGAVIAFVDITSLRHSLEATRSARDYATAIVDAVPSPLIVLDDQLVVRSANRAFHDLVPGALVGRPFFAVADWHGAALRKELERVVAGGAPFETLRLEHRAPGGGSRFLLAGARIISRSAGGALLLLGMSDVTAQHRCRARARGVRQRGVARAPHAAERDPAVGPGRARSRSRGSAACPRPRHDRAERACRGAPGRRPARAGAVALARDRSADQRSDRSVRRGAGGARRQPARRARQADRDRLHARGRHEDPGRPAPDAPDRRQPDLERDQVHAARRPGLDHGRARGPRDGAPRARLGRRHPGRAPGAPVRAVLPGRSVAHPHPARPRHRPRAGPSARRAPGRHGRGRRRRRGAGRHVHRADPGAPTRQLSPPCTAATRIISAIDRADSLWATRRRW